MGGHEPLYFAILDDHPLVRDGISFHLRFNFPGSFIAYSGEVVREAISAVSHVDRRVAIVDLDLGTGIAPAEVVSSFSLYNIPVVVVSAYASAANVESTMAAGALAFVAKKSAETDLAEAVAAVLEGKVWISRELEISLGRSQRVKLSEQERRALMLYGSGLTLDMVAHRMGVKRNTAKDYIDRVREKYSKMGIEARTKIQLNAAAREDGLL